MDYSELSLKNVRDKNKDLFNKIDFDYDCVIFIARGAYIIGKDLADFKAVPLLEIKASRKGGKLKKLIRPFLQMIPSLLKKKLREKEMNKVSKAPSTERNVSFDEKAFENVGSVKNLLLVDDSVDTGYSVKACVDAIRAFYKGATVKIAAFNVFDASKEIVTTDFFLYTNTCIQGPWSNDSTENKEYIKEYEAWHETSL